MKFTSQSIPDVLLIEPDIYSDNRGYFLETFRQDLLDSAIGEKVNFVQENESKSSKGVLRGLHYQIPPFSQAKLVSVNEGKVLDIAVDIRKSSLTFGQHVAVELSDINKNQIYIPHGFAHGFIVLSDTAIFSYKVDSYYAPEYDHGFAFNDTNLSIDWKIAYNLIKLSLKDKNLPSFSDSLQFFE